MLWRFSLGPGFSVRSSRQHLNDLHIRRFWLFSPQMRAYDNQARLCDSSCGVLIVCCSSHECRAFTFQGLDRPSHETPF